jgi:hypothetical protein
VRLWCQVKLQCIDCSAQVTATRVLITSENQDEINRIKIMETKKYEQWFHWVSGRQLRAVWAKEFFAVPHERRWCWLDCTEYDPQMDWRNKAKTKFKMNWCE